MDLKSIILLLGLWKIIYCKYCRIYSSEWLGDTGCNFSFICYNTSNMALRALTRRYVCPSFNISTTFSNIPCDETITCSDCDEFLQQASGSLVNLEIIDNACSSMPSFDDFPNVEVIRIHNTRLEDVSIASKNSLHKLITLDLSRNQITNISILELDSSSNLEVLDISYNMVNTITKHIFSHIPSLKKLYLTKNRINNINSLTFRGLHNLNTLYLSSNNITSINSAFESLTNLEEIQLDHNNLYEIKESWFIGLEKLTHLNLNSNFIIKFDWTTMEHIPMLNFFDVSNNKIENVTKTAFAKNNHLSYVDLSFNNIKQLYPNTFLKKNIEVFVFRNNSLIGSLVKGMFEGMKAVSQLDLSYLNIDAIGDRAFYGLFSLSNLLLNNNKIQNISKVAFYSLVNLQILDLSNNMLHFIDLNQNKLNNLNQLRLENNLITDIGTDSFMGMLSLEFLDLSQNNLTTLNSDKYGAILPHLKQLNISHNSLQIIQEDIFDKFVNILSIDLSYNSNLKIAYNSTKLTLVTNSAAQASSRLQTLRITNCNIDKTFFLKMNCFITILHLDFTFNKIPNIEYGMFSSNKKLVHLDLSFNKISYIQPGSFKDNNELKELNIAHNELLEIEHGCFLGLNTLNFLDISFNKIKTLKHGKFYETSNLITLIADNNTIESIEYIDFVGTNLRTLSIGANPMPCLLLVNLKTEMHTLQVTAINKEHHLPNFNGIACDPDNHNDEESNNDTNMYFERRDALLKDIRDVLLEIKNAPNEKRFDSVTENIQKSFYQNEASWEDDARAHFDKVESNVGESMQPTQRKFSVLSDICLIFIAVVMLCSLLYKVYELNLFKSLRRRCTTSTQLLERQMTNSANEDPYQFN